MKRVFYLSERIYMNNFGKKFAIAAITGIMSLAVSMTAFAASGIKSVKININSDAITVGKPRNIDDVTVNTSGSNYNIEGVDFLEMGTDWQITDIPKITVHLAADENYYFSVYKAEDFKITGGELIEARRENTSNDLYVDIQLPALTNQVSPIESVTLNSSGLATWSASQGASGYQAKLVRENSSTIGGVQSFTTNSANLKYLLNRQGTYVLKVRALSSDAQKNGPWVTSNTITVSQAEAARNYNESRSQVSQSGKWQHNNTGWWYTLADGSYVTSSWRQINGEWYYFNADGYMLVGWQQIGGNWYYMDLNSGKMLSNTTTPDGYYVGISGAYSATGK